MSEDQGFLPGEHKPEIFTITGATEEFISGQLRDLVQRGLEIAPIPATACQLGVSMGAARALAGFIATVQSRYPYLAEGMTMLAVEALRQGLFTPENLGSTEALNNAI